jgi:hypothetical protein
VPPERDSQPVREFRTFTSDLHRLADWLVQCEVKTVAMESTGVYWIPLYEILEQRGLEVLLVNARDVHNVRGRKSDVQDCEWLRDLHSVGLLRPSFRSVSEISCSSHTMTPGRAGGSVWRRTKMRESRMRWWINFWPAATRQRCSKAAG